LAADKLDEDAFRSESLCQLFLRELEKNFSGGVFVHAAGARSPHILNFALEGVDSRAILDSIPQLCISRSSACSKSDAPSHVLAAVCTPEIAACSIRVSPGRGTSEDDMIAAANLLADGIEKLRMGS
jgi:cysteine sulfinate desulfinase/cysteine desulfurase-like protein